MKKYLSNIINCIKRKDSNTEENDRLLYLSPKVLKGENLNTISPYLNLLKDCIENNNITNIAVTGNYGSGKSTVLKTFQHWYEPYKAGKNKNYLNISLASFEYEKEKLSDKEGLSFEQKVEFSILQQMIYQVKPKTLPGSRFRRLSNINKLHLFANISLFISMILSFLILNNYELLKIRPIKYLIKNSDSEWNLIPLSLLLFGLGVMIRKVFYLFNNSKIHKINIKGEMELGNMDDSIFNQYLEEIIYFFERTKYKVVILEDIDRFGDIQLFTKLREINILLNNSEVIKRPIKFIYAVKDDMFKNRSERTKFFDYIIPIIPYVNPSNSSEQFLKLIQENEIDGELTADFIEDFMSFIGDVDMRLILNIFNEFNLYRENITAGSSERLLAMIVYKNLYPKDFALLHQDKGSLYSFLALKEEYKKELNIKLNTRIKDIDNKITEIKNEKVESIKELRKIYLFHLLAEIPELIKFDLGFTKIIDAIIDENFKKIRESEIIEFKKYSYNHYSLAEVGGKKKNPFNDIENEISEVSYLDREKRIKNRIRGEIEVLRNERINYTKEISKTNLLSFSELFEKTGTNEDFENLFDELESPGEKSLIKYLIRNEYIGDDYKDYISLFFDVSIKRADYEFIQNIKIGNEGNFSYKPTDNKKVLDKIPTRYFSQSQSLNYELLSYCLRNSDSEKQKLKLYMDNLSIDDPTTIEFILKFNQEKEEDIQLLIPYLVKYKSNFWKLLHQSELPREELQKWVEYIFDYAEDVESIKNFQNKEELKNFISESKIFELLSSLFIVDNLMSFIIDEKIKVIHLDKPFTDSDKLWKQIAEHQLYELNFHNIVTLAKEFNPNIDEEELKDSNYTTLIVNDLTYILDYIESDLDFYVKSILLLEENNKESRDSVIKIINSDSVKQATKKRFVKHQRTIILSLEDILEIENKTLLLESNKLLPIWRNIYHYISSVDNKIDKALLDFLNDRVNYLILADKKITIDDVDDEDELKKFNLKIINETLIDDEAYINLIKSLSYTYNSIDLSDIETNKVKILIEAKVLNFTKSNYEELSSYDSDLLMLFFETNEKSKDFLNKIQEFEIDDDSIALLLQSKLITSNKLQIVEDIDSNRLTESQELSESVFNWWNNKLRIEFDYISLKALFKAGDLEDKKLELLIKHINNLDDDELSSLTKLIGNEYQKLFMPYQRPKFLKINAVARLLSELKERQMISSYNEDRNQIKAYPLNK